MEKLNNFNGVKEVLACLQSASVYRLKKTKEFVNGKYLKALEGLKKLTGSEFNYKHLRSKIHSKSKLKVGVDPPLIPFPGVYQGDLVYLEGYEKNLVEDGMINFSKFQKVCSYVVELQVT